MYLKELFLPNGSLTWEGKNTSVDHNPADYRSSDLSCVQNLHHNKIQVMYVSNLVRTMHLKNFICSYDRLQQPS